MKRTLLSLSLSWLAVSLAHAQTVVGTIDVGNPNILVQITDFEDSNQADNIAIIVTNNAGAPFVCSGLIGFYNLQTGSEDPSWAVTGQSTIPTGGPYTLVSAINPMGSGEGNTTAYDTASCSAQTSTGGSGGTGSQGTSLAIVGNVSYQTVQSGADLQIKVDQVINNSPNVTSGSLRLEVWALVSPMSGTGLSPNGYKLAESSLPPGCPNSVLAPLGSCNAIVVTGPLTLPPAGTYYSTLFLTEYNSTGGCPQPDFYCWVSYVNFPGTFTITSGGQPGNTAGGVDFVGPSTYSLSNGSLAVKVNEIINNSPSRTTGSLRFDVWALTAPYAAGQPNSGYDLLIEPLQNTCTVPNGQLTPTEFCQNMSFSQSVMNTPPAGTYYVTIFVEEYDPVNCTTTSHYCVDSSIQYSPTLSVSPPAPTPTPTSPSTGGSSGGGGGSFDGLGLLLLSLLGAIRCARKELRRLGGVLALCQLSLLITACGGGGGGPSTPPAVAPSISAQPQSVTVNQGASATFSVTATGTAPLTYQWSRGGVAISGATSSTYQIASTAATDNGASFTVAVSNSAGNQASNAATLTVNIPPAISQQTSNVQAPVGGSATLSVTATGTAPLTYQWKENGTAISGATNSSLILNPTLAKDHGAAFTVSITNVVTSITSQPMTLTISPPIALLAGAPGGVGNLDGAAGIARMNGAGAVIGGPVNAAGHSTLTFIDIGSQKIRSFDTSTGAISTLAGTGTAGYKDGPAASAEFNFFYVTHGGGLAYDSTGNLYVADMQNSVIRKIDTSGNVTTLAGVAGAVGLQDGTGSGALFHFPTDIAFGYGVLYVFDSVNCALRMVTLTGGVSTLLGGTCAAGLADGAGAAAKLALTGAMTAPGAGGFQPITPSVYMANGNLIRVATAPASGPGQTYTLTTIAGNVGTNTCGYVNGTKTGSAFCAPSGIVVDVNGNLYVSDMQNHAVRQVVASTGVVTTIAGSPANLSILDGTGAAAGFQNLEGIAITSTVGTGTANTLVVGDYSTLRQVYAGSGVVSTIGGVPETNGTTDGAASAARFESLNGIAIDANGNTFVPDASASTVRKVGPTGTTTTIAGLAGTPGNTDGTGNGARFTYPTGVAVDGSGNIYIGDPGTQSIRKITVSNGVYTVGTLASNTALIQSPWNLAVDAKGDVFAIDPINCTIVEVPAGGAATVFAGSTCGSLDGTGTAAKFQQPRGIAIDASGNLYVADTYNDTIRKVTSAGVVTTIAGVAGTAGYVEGPASAAEFALPTALAVDSLGNIYVADQFNNVIRKIDTTNTVSTVTGAKGSVGNELGALPGSLSQPSGLAIYPGSNTSLVMLSATEADLITISLP